MPTDWIPNQPIYNDQLQAMVLAIRELQERMSIVESAAGPATPHPVDIVVRLASESSGDYHFRQVRWNSAGTALEDMPGGLSSETATNMTSISQTATPYRPMQTDGSVNGLPVGAVGTGAICTLRWEVRDGAAYKPTLYPWEFSGAFRVKMTQTGGSSGDASTKCSYTYTVKDNNDLFTFATVFDPTGTNGNHNRPDVLVQMAATEGWATFDGDGHFLLLDCNEKTQTESC